MTFLEICKKVRQKVGVSGTGPSTVIEQQGALLRIVDCVIEAWREIQESNNKNWLFMLKDGVMPLTDGEQHYTLAEVVAEIATYGEAVIGSLKYGDGARLTYKSWEQWDAENIDLGTETGRPNLWTKDGEGGLHFYRIPDDDYSVRLRYKRATQVLAVDADVPVCPPEFHMAIVFRAALIYAELDEAPELINILTPEYRTWISKLESNQLPKIGYGPSKFQGRV